MRKLNYWFLASLLSGALLITSCSDKDDDPTPTPPAPEVVKDKMSEGTEVSPANMTMSALSGFVYDSDGNPLPYVKVISGSKSCETGMDGGFVLDEVKTEGDRSIVTFSCRGYFDAVRSMPTKAGDVWEVVMVSTADGGNVAIKEDMPTDQDNSVQTSQGMTVELQAEGFIYAESGTPLGEDDKVTAKVLYLSPDDEDFATMMPGGDLAALNESSEPVQLVSYGMVCVNLTAGGERVQLANEKEATLTFPVPDRFKDSEIPAEIPLWSFDEEKGLWIYEDVATYDPDKNAYVGKVKHFSWVNLDYAQSRATLIVNVTDSAGNVIPNQAVDIDGQKTNFTNVNGKLECYVPINTDFYVAVRSSDYSNYNPEIKVNVDKILTAGETKTVNIKLPVLNHISGKVDNSGKGNNLSAIWIEYVENGADKSTKPVHTDAQGQFILNAPYGYRGAAKLVLMASDGSRHEFDITLDGKDHAYTLGIETNTSSGGVITYTPNSGASVSVVVPPIFVTDYQGAMIFDNRLSFRYYYYDYNAGRNNFLDLNVDVNNYSVNKKVYNNDDSYFSLYATDLNDLNFVVKTLTVTKNASGTFTFQVDGDARKYDYDSKNYMTVGAVNGEFTVPMLFVAKSIRKIGAKDGSFPSFTPWIEGDSASLGIQITESKALGKGVLLMFPGRKHSYDDFKTFVAQAKTALGDPIDSYVPDETAPGFDPDECEARCSFYKDGKYVLVSFRGWNKDFNGEEEWILSEITHHGGDGIMRLFSGDEVFSYIQVFALEGLRSIPDYNYYYNAK